MAVLTTSASAGSLLRMLAASALGTISRGWSLFWTRFGWGVVLLLFVPPEGHAQSKEYQIKAAFLYNFAQFVLWPETTFTNANEPFRIGVLGDNPFGKALQETVRGETIQGHQIVVAESSDAGKLADCQILFVSKADAAHFNDVFPKLDSKPVLTVSEDSGLFHRGGVINFYRDGSKIRFQINPDAADKKGLKLGSELLSVGKIVHSDTPK